MNRFGCKWHLESVAKQYMKALLIKVVIILVKSSSKHYAHNVYCYVPGLRALDVRSDGFDLILWLATIQSIRIFGALITNSISEPALFFSKKDFSALQSRSQRVFQSYKTASQRGTFM